MVEQEAKHNNYSLARAPRSNDQAPSTLGSFVAVMAQCTLALNTLTGDPPIKVEGKNPASPKCAWRFRHARPASAIFG